MKLVGDKTKLFPTLRFSSILRIVSARPCPDSVPLGCGQRLCRAVAQLEREIVSFTMAGRAKKAPVRKKANGYKMPAPIPSGEVISDVISKKKWRIGPSIGVGGFGEIYSACDDNKPPKNTASYPYVVKIEPHENGPLFVEKHFYLRNANKDDITSYMKENKITSLGMPTYHGNGSHNYKDEKYRYLVLERYGKDLWTIFKDNGKSFPPQTVFLLGLQMLEVLEYIHTRGYVHADIKGANILLGLKKGTENQAYLVDFGLATRVSDKEFKPDPKSAHNGTIEYTSRDAHLGAPTMRGDLEILAYNMLQWLVGELPWEKSLKDPKKVQQQKQDFMAAVRSNITGSYPNVPDELIKFFEYINTMEPKEAPDYSKCRKIFEAYLKTQGCSRSSKLEFSGKKAKAKATKQAVASASEEDEDSENMMNSRVIKTKAKMAIKRTSSDTLLVKTIKKTKMTPKAKANHVNIATQTSIDKLRRSPRAVRFDSPLSAVIGESRTARNAKALNYNESCASSPDMFEDSLEKKPRKEKKLIADQKITVTRKVVKKTTAAKAKGKSWRDTPTIMNGRKPPVE